MIKKNTLFQSVCLFGIALFIIIVFFPLVTKAINYSPPETNDRAAQPTVRPKDIPPPAVAVIDRDLSPPPAGLPVYDTFTVAERQAAGLPTDLPPLIPYYSPKTVYLTFDDGPDPDTTPRILKILHDQGVKATFFVIGTQVEKNPAILMMTFKEGHAIGNHSYNHIYRQLYRSSATYTAQLEYNDAVIKKIIGMRPLISRAPGGTTGFFTKDYWVMLKKLGYIDIGWNVVAGDASAAMAFQLVGNVRRQLNANKYLWDHAIVLMHDGPGHAETVKALPEIIKLFKERGFKFEIVDLNTPPAW